jgi:hypothetical protein
MLYHILDKIFYGWTKLSNFKINHKFCKTIKIKVAKLQLNRDILYLLSTLYFDFLLKVIVVNTT